jgi:hypothetical protein
VDPKTRAIFRQAMREIGREGGKIGGKRSLETMTPEERTARAGTYTKCEWASFPRQMLQALLILQTDFVQQLCVGQDSLL